MRESRTNELKNESKADESLSWDDWFATSRTYHLTIADVENWDRRESYDLLCFDRNVLDLTYCNELGVSTDPATYFRAAYKIRASYIDGEWRFIFPEFNDDDRDQFQEFHIEFSKGNWYPLFNGIIGGNPNDAQAAWLPERVRGRPMASYEGSTRLGWRGPCMLWSKALEMPQLYRNINEEEE